jgi:hypothetical protein
VNAAAMAAFSLGSASRAGPALGRTHYPDRQCTQQRNDRNLANDQHVLITALTQELLL